MEINGRPCLVNPNKRNLSRFLCGFGNLCSNSEAVFYFLFYFESLSRKICQFFYWLTPTESLRPPGEVLADFVVYSSALFVHSNCLYLAWPPILKESPPLVPGCYWIIVVKYQSSLDISSGDLHLKPSSFQKLFE